MKIAILCFLISVGFSATAFRPKPVELTPTETEVLDIIGGILDGVLIDLTVADIKTCLTDIETIGKDLMSAVKSLEEENPIGVKAGIVKIGDTLDILPGAIKTCQTGYAEEIAKLKSLVAIFSSPASFAYDVGESLLINGHEIYNEVDDAITQFHAASWFNFGKDIGEALAQCIFH